MSLDREQRIRRLLKGIATGDPAAVEVIHPERYIQHNPQTHEGREGLVALFARLAKDEPRVNLVRVFSDGDYVFAHTEYDFSRRRIGFEVFRFEGEHVVEHWDNIQLRQGPNLSGHDMVGGPTRVTEHALKEQNRKTVQRFVDAVLIGRQLDQLEALVHHRVTEHDPESADGIEALRLLISGASPRGQTYQRLHRVLADGNFVLSASEGVSSGKHSAFYDLYRLETGLVVEHWNTIEAVAPRAEWKNDYGKF